MIRYIEKFKITVFIGFFVFNSAQASFTDLSDESVRKKIQWFNSQLTIEQQKTIMEIIHYGLKKRTKGEFDDAVDSVVEHNKLSGLVNTGFCVRYDASSRKVLEAIHEVSKINKEQPMKIADLGCGHGHLTILIPNAVEQPERLTLAFVDGVDLNTQVTKEAIKFSNQHNLNQKTTFRWMTKYLQDLDTTNFFGLKENESFDILIGMNLIHFLNFKEKQDFFKTCHRLLRMDGKLIFSFDSYANLTQKKNSLGNIKIFDLSNQDFNKSHNIIKFKFNPKTKIVSAPPQTDIHFYDNQHYYLMSPDLTQVTERLNLSNFFEKVNNLKSNESLIFGTYFEQTSEESILEILITAGFNTETARIEYYLFDHINGTEFEGLLNLHPSYNSNTSLYVEVKKQGYNIVKNLKT